MTKIVNTVTDYEAKGLETLVEVQGRALDYFRTAVERIDDVLPEDRPELPAEVPTVKEIVDTQFAFAKKVLANQEKFAKDLVKAIAPLSLPRQGSAPKVVKAA